MTNYYVDTSALGKRYLSESGSSWVQSWIEPAAQNVLFICGITPIELLSIFGRRQREGALTQQAANILENDFLYHVQREYLTVTVDDVVLAHARRLIKQYPLRALDSIQLASALHTAKLFAEPIIFASSDKQLLQAAMAEGFTVDDPNQHP